MGIEEIVKKIVSEEADQERNQLLKQAHAQASGIAKKANAEIESAIAWNKPIFDQRGAVARARIIHQAEFEAQTKNADEKQRIYLAFLEKVSKSLSSIASSPECKDLLKQLIQEALGMVDCPVTVHVRQEDVAMAEQALKDLDRNDLKVVGDLKGWGGARLKSLDGAISLDNTLESRFKKALEVFKEEIGKDLFA